MYNIYNNRVLERCVFLCVAYALCEQRVMNVNTRVEKIRQMIGFNLYFRFNI